MIITAQLDLASWDYWEEFNNTLIINTCRIVGTLKHAELQIDTLARLFG